MEHIRGAAAYYELEVPPVLFMESKKDYFNVIQALNGDRTKPFRVISDGQEVFSLEEWPNTVVIDSLTDSLDMIDREMGKELGLGKSQSSGLPEKSFSYWNGLTDRCKRFIKQFRDIDANVVFLCLKKVKDADKRTTRYTGPELPTMKLGSFLSSTVNICAQMRRYEQPKLDENGETTLDEHRRIETEYHYSVCMRGEEHEIMKSDICLETYEQPNISMIINKLGKEVRDASQ
jgi:hypothetical protein